MGVVPDLARSFRVVTYGRRGHSASEATPGQGSRRQDEDDLAGLIEGLGLAPAHVGANSFSASRSVKRSPSDRGPGTNSPHLSVWYSSETLPRFWTSSPIRNGRIWIWQPSVDSTARAGHARACEPAVVPEDHRAFGRCTTEREDTRLRRRRPAPHVSHPAEYVAVLTGFIAGG